MGETCNYRKQLRSFGIKIFRLVVDLVLMTWGVVRNLVLPTRGRKGNILSSLHDLYIGLVDLIAGFERAILPRAVVFDNRYVKRVLVLVSCFLFLLSSLEWPPAIQKSASISENGIVAAQTQKRPDRRIHRFCQTKLFQRQPAFPHSSLSAVATSPSLLPDGLPQSRRWVLFHVLRV